MGHKHNAPYEIAYSCGKSNYRPEMSIEEAKEEAFKMAWHLVSGVRIYGSTRARYFRELMVAYLAAIVDVKGDIEGLFAGSGASPFDEGEHSDDRLPKHGTYYIQKYSDDDFRVYLVQPYKSPMRWTVKVYQMSKYKTVANAQTAIKRQQAMVEAL